MAFAGMNEAGLSCDLHALLNSSYPPLSTAVGKKNIMLYYFCNWALAQFDTAAAVKAASMKRRYVPTRGQCPVRSCISTRSTSLGRPLGYHGCPPAVRWFCFPPNN